MSKSKKANAGNAGRVNVYEVVTERILAALEKGVAPWRKPWRSGPQGMPKNLISGKEYRGVNVFLLGVAPFASPYWLTFRQAKERGGNVRKGERGTPVVFYKTYEGKPGADGEKDRRFVLRYYTVFNVEQCEGLRDVPATPGETRTAHERIAACETVVRRYSGPDYGPRIETGSLACYRPLTDAITMPPLESFAVREEYYSTLFHELAHSTGAKHRLDRDGITGGTTFGDHAYSFEELIAECGAAFLCGETGIDAITLDNSAAYLANWSRKLKSEPTWIVKAASAAAKAADLILGRKPTATPSAPASAPDAPASGDDASGDDASADASDNGDDHAKAAE